MVRFAFDSVLNLRLFFCKRGLLLRGAQIERIDGGGGVAAAVAEHIDLSSGFGVFLWQIIIIHGVIGLAGLHRAAAARLIQTELRKSVMICVIAAAAEGHAGRIVILRLLGVVFDFQQKADLLC